MQQSTAILKFTTRFTFLTSNRSGIPPLHDLTENVQNRGAANILLVLSAADLHWDDLVRHLTDHQDWLSPVTVVCGHIVWITIWDGPHIVAQWFDVRFIICIYRRQYTCDPSQRYQGHNVRRLLWLSDSDTKG
ncbi:hypothetical protein PEX1_069160 [Penicillium expansum]|uniref:Uncharacterized protein n=1 Tax=Penicillium expansum TaxID=27334 RepID=A0A0A2I7C5_PENEN|nr:hypothetical protein PEX2_026050 [Penicillium expansum]KGO38328.1 hypothetical protein PEXP_100660 [Penicillium expansum]KGO54067.1 hypothetical protein PEX2_026050 [Penicillium expansum]KGO63428.1 hypothetical protein PEX1_069160 [Penicillium expansum]